MTKHIEWTDQQKIEWDSWVSGRPECVQKMCKSHPPDNIYKMKSTGHIVTLVSYFEDDTVKVSITNDIVKQTFMERYVFDVNLDDLELWNGKDE